MHWFSENWKALRSFLGNAAPPSRGKVRTFRHRKATFEALSSREMLSVSPDTSSCGTLVLSSSNTYIGSNQDGSVNISGTVSANSNVTLSDGALTDNTNAAVNPVALTLNNTSSNTTGGVSLTAGNANLSTGTMQAGTFTLAAVNPYNDSTTNLNVPIAAAGTSTLTLSNNPTIGDASTTVNGGTLRFVTTSGAATIGTGVTATVASAATLELAGTISNLSDPSAANRVHIVNNSTQAYGGSLWVGGSNQQVGAIDGIGTTMVSAGSDLTANHIVQNALVIGGNASSNLVTIDASDSSGLPLTSTLTLGQPLKASGSGPPLSGTGTTHSTTHVVFSHKMVSAHDPLIAAHHFAGHRAMTRAGGG